MKEPIDYGCMYSVTQPMLKALPLADREQAGLEQLAEEIVRCYEHQVIGFDLVDVNRILAALQHPVLGIAVATGPSGAVDAARQAAADAQRTRSAALVTLVFPTGEARLQAFSQVRKILSVVFEPNADLIFGMGYDPQLTPGSVRVSVLAG